MTRRAVLLAASACLAFSQKMTPKTLGKIYRDDDRLDAILQRDSVIEVLASGFEWSEGPVWWASDKSLLFSDIPRNSVMRWREGQSSAEVFIKPSGYTGPGDYGKEPGCNGLTFNKAGQLVSCEHGDRRISVRDANGQKRTLVDRYEGKRLNSPNDCVFKSNGDLYFTDPPYGLPKNWDDERRELPFCGVYRLSADGKVTLLSKDLSRPNGIAFSPDERTLYVANSDPARAIWMAFPVKADGTLGVGKIFSDATAAVDKLPGLPDGMKVDRAGNLFATGPGGVHIFSPDGTRLGRIETGEKTANCAWGDNGSTLYITADMHLCRVKKVKTGGQIL